MQRSSSHLQNKVSTLISQLLFFKNSENWNKPRNWSHHTLLTFNKHSTDRASTTMVKHLLGLLVYLPPPPPTRWYCSPFMSFPGSTNICCQLKQLYRAGQWGSILSRETTIWQTWDGKNYYFIRVNKIPFLSFLFTAACFTKVLVFTTKCLSWWESSVKWQTEKNNC